MEEALQASDPRILGAFRVVSRLTERDAGVVFRAESPFREPAVVVMLHPAAAAEPGVRGRFESLTADALAAEPRGLVAWAAFPDVEAGVRALDEAALVSGAGAGPAFVPHWVPQPQSRPGLPSGPPPLSGPLRSGSPPAGMTGRKRTVIALVAGVWAVLTGLSLWGLLSDSVLMHRGDRTQRALGTPTSPSEEPPLPLPPLPTPPSPSLPTSEPSTKAPNGKPGLVAGPTYGKGEKTYHMKLHGFPFEFDAPGTWGCMRSDKEPFESRWICVDDGGRFGGEGSGAGGMVAVKGCSAGCDEKRLEKTLVVDASDWRRTDPSTMYAEVLGDDEDGKRVVRVAMTHVHEGTGVAVQLTGPPSQKATMQKLINEIRRRT